MLPDLFQEFVVHCPQNVVLHHNNELHWLLPRSSMSGPIPRLRIQLLQATKLYAMPLFRWVTGLQCRCSGTAVRRLLLRSAAPRWRSPAGSPADSPLCQRPVRFRRCECAEASSPAQPSEHAEVRTATEQQLELENLELKDKIRQLEMRDPVDLEY